MGPLSCAKIVGALYTALGLIIGAIVSLIAAAGGFAASDSSELAVVAVFGVGAIVFFPLMYGGLGFVTTLIAAWLYNGTASFVGGIELEIK